MSEAELERDIHSVLAKVRQGVEIVIEQDHKPIAVIKSSGPVGRPASEVLADLTKRASDAVMDDGFAQAIEDGLLAQRKPWEPPSWD